MPPNSLEQEAMDRVARMYANFDRRPQNRPKAPTPPEPPKPEPKSEPEPPKDSEFSPQKKQGGFLELMMKDKDQSLILLLLVILMKDGADLNLMLALLYLLL